MLVKILRYALLNPNIAAPNCVTVRHPIKCTKLSKMSVFFKNVCHFNTCRKNFYTLSDLIVHIENDHLDFDPNKIEQLEEEKPESLPLSYVLKYSGPEEFPQYDEVSFLNEAVIQELDDVAANEVVTALNNNYLGCDFKELELKVRVEARLNKEEIPQILGGNKLFTLDHSHKKPFACNMKGCEKRYKNVNGIKYHYKKHHQLLIPTLKKSQLKHKPKLEKRDLHGIPLYSYKPPVPDNMYHNYHNMHRFEDCEALSNEYFYKFNTLPTSDVHPSSRQVPLPNNTSFNYYNVADEDFSGKNSNYFVPSFDKF